MRWIAVGVLLLGLLGAACAANTPPSTPERLPSPTAGAAVVVPSAPTALPVIQTPPAAAVATAQTAQSPSLPTATAAATSQRGAATTATAGAPPAGALLLLVTEPAESPVEVPANATSIVVTGRTRPGAVLSVNGRLAQTGSDGSFRVTVPLVGELSLIEIIASDSTGQQLREQVVVVRAD